MMGSRSARSAADDTQGLSGPARDPSGGTAQPEPELSEAHGSETPTRIGTREEAVTSPVVSTTVTNGAGSDTPLREVGSPNGTPLLSAGDSQAELRANPVREVDQRNGNAARARKQAAKQPEMVEDEAGNVLRRASALVVPEEKRCQAVTVRGERCRVGKIRGMEVCVFHAHRALSDEQLIPLVDPEAKPRLSPRKALQAVVALRAEELGAAAVDGALSAEGAGKTRAILSLVDAVDPLTAEESSITLSREGVEELSLKQLRSVLRP